MMIQLIMGHELKHLKKSMTNLNWLWGQLCDFRAYFNRSLTRTDYYIALEHLKQMHGTVQ